MFTLYYKQDLKGKLVPDSLSYQPDHIKKLTHEELVSEINKYHDNFIRYINPDHKKKLADSFFSNMETKNYYLPLRVLALLISTNTECNINDPNERLDIAIQITKILGELSHKEACHVYSIIICNLLTHPDSAIEKALSIARELLELLKNHDIERAYFKEIKNYERLLNKKELENSHDEYLETSVSMRPRWKYLFVIGVDV